MARTVDKGHGRLEIRVIIASSELNEVLQGRWAGIDQVFSLHARCLISISACSHSQSLSSRVRTLRIHDDGLGLPPALNQTTKDGSFEHISPGHYGLRGMLERIEAIGGRLVLHSGKEQGTTIEVELPLARSQPL